MEEEKKQIKISLGTAICLVIIVILVIALVGVVCYNWDKNEDKTINDVNKKTENILLETGKTNQENKKDENEEAIEKISKENTHFIIDKIEQKNDKYEITAYILEKERKTFTQEEYNQILQGKEIEFRNKMWKYDQESTDAVKSDNITAIKSGDSILALLFDKDENVYFLENIAGAKIGGLSDIIKQSIKFEVDEDFYFCDDGAIGDLITWFSNAYESGSYEECWATVHNGKVVKIQIMPG